MRLSTEYLIGLLSVIQGLHFSNALNIDTHSDPCVAKILSCDLYRKPFSLYEEKAIGMFTEVKDLNKACKAQAPYMRCIAWAENFCEKTFLSHMAEEMMKSRRFPAEICQQASMWQQLYLKEARCLNAHSRKAFLLCVDKMVGTGNLNPDNAFERGCWYGKAIIDCSATALQEKCGYYAGNILKKFLRFHSLTEYKCFEYNPEDIEDYSFSSTPDYEPTEAIFSYLDAAVSVEDFDMEAAETNGVNTNLEGTKLDHLESQISSGDSILEEAFSTFDFNHPPVEDSLTTTEYFLPDSSDHFFHTHQIRLSDKESQDMSTEPDKFEFPALPNYRYIHKNRTTFALYEDFNMGHMKYMGCGEADVFWIILSPPRSKYCILTDLQSEYSEVIFKCTIRIDASCSSELDYEDRNKKAEVFHRRYIATVLTPSNKRSEDMVIMNVHYLKLYQSTHVPEKANLWTTEADKANTDQTVSVGRKGYLEMESDRSDIYQHGNGSGQKWNKDAMNSPNHLDEDEENGNWDHYALEVEEDIYFPELLANNIIYIEDEKGNLISLHDHRSPIYSKSVYKPHSLFRPRSGAMPPSTVPQELDEIGTNQKRKLAQSSVFKERVSEFQNEAPISEVKPDQQKYCSAEAPCYPNSEFASGFEIKPGMYLLSRNIETFDPFKEGNQQIKRLPTSFNLKSDIDLKPFLRPRGVYVVTPSAEIKVPKSTESSLVEELYGDEFTTNLLEEDEFSTDRSRKFSVEDEFATDRSRYLSGEDEFATDRSRYLSEEDEFATDRSRYQPEENEFSTGRSKYPPEEEAYYIKDKAHDSRYLDPDYSYETSVPNPVDSKIGSMEPFSGYYIDAFTRPPYSYKHTDTQANCKDAIDTESLKAEASEDESLFEGNLEKIIRKISIILLKITEQFKNWKLLDEILDTLENDENILNFFKFISIPKFDKHKDY